MADWRDAEGAADDWREAEGGAMGGTGSDSAPSKQLIRPKPVAPEDPEAKAAEEKRRMALAVSGMTGGQNIASLPEDKRDAFATKSTEKALGQGIALARGAPLVGSHLDELSAFLQSGGTSGPEYEKKVAAARSAVGQAETENPALSTVGSLAFSPAQPASAGGRIALGLLSGASEGAGSAQSMSEVPRNALAGGTQGVIMSLLGEGMRAGGGFLGDKKQGVLDKARAQSDKAIDKGWASARGAAGADVASGARILEVAERSANDPGVSEAVRKAAREFLDSPQGVALREQVAMSNLARGEDQLARIQSSRDAMVDYADKMTPEARAAAAQARIDDPTALKRRVRELLPKIALPAVGTAVGGAPGAAVGGLLGALMGRSATTVRNAMVDPYVSSRVLGAGESALKGAGAATQSLVPSATRELEPWSRFLKPEEEQQP